MAIETAKESLCLNQIVGQKNENIIAESDAIIPDIKPDILSTINTSGTVCIYKKEVMEGKIKIDGGINVYIMYISDSENSAVRTINTTIDFSKTVDMQNVKEGMELENNIYLRNIECKVLNGRKINVKALMDVNLKVYSNENINIIKDINNVKDIQMLNQDININSLLGSGNTRVYAKDTLAIDATDNLADIMNVNININNQETKTSYNKILAKADANISIMYITEDDRINEINAKIPVMGFIDMPDVADTNICNTSYEIKNMVVKPNNVSEHSIYVEIEMELKCMVYESKVVNIIQDLYSPSECMETKQKNISVMQDKKIIENTCCVREKQIIPEIKGGKIYNVEAVPSITKQSILSNRIMYEGELELKIFYQSSKSIEVKIQKIPFTHNVECNELAKNNSLKTNIEITLQDFVVMQDDSMDIKVDLKFIIDLFKNAEVNVINEINIVENRIDDAYSVIVYFVKPGDSLWKIAKRFRSTVRDIAVINGIEDENKINVGDQLFIPRYIARKGA